MLPVRQIALSALILSVLLFSIPAISQPPSTGRQPVAPLKPAPSVVTLLKAGNTAQQAKPPKYDEAERQYTLALNEARRLHDRVGESRALLNLGNVASKQNQQARTLDFYQQSLAICRETNHKKGEGDAVFNIALLYIKTDPSKADEYLRQARDAYHEAGETTSEIQSLSAIGRSNQQQGRIHLAKEAYTEAAILAHAIGNAKEEADAIWYRGTLFTFEKDADPARPTLDEAKADLVKAAALYDKLKDYKDEAWTNTLIGGIHFFQGHVGEDRKYYEKALANYRKAGDKKDATAVLSELANLCGFQGSLAEALRYDQEALDYYHKAGDVAGEAGELMHIASLYWNFGQTGTSLNYYKKALPLVQQTGNINGQINALQNLGAGYQILRQFEVAAKYYVMLMPLLDKPKDIYEQAHYQALKAAVYYALGKYQQQRDTLEAELAFEKEKGLTPFIPTTISILAQAEYTLGHNDRALELYRESLQLRNANGNDEGTASLLSSIAEIEEKQGDLDAAERDMRGAVAATEKVRTSLGGLSAAKSTFLASNFSTYQQYLALLLRRNKAEDAFALVQKMKARALLDIIQSGKVQLAASLTPEERAQEKQLRAQSDILNYKLVKEGVQNEIGSRLRAEAIKLQIADAERDLQVFEDKLYVSHPDLAEKRAAKTITLEDTAKFLPEDTALLEYVTLKVGATDETVLFVITRQVGASVITTHLLSISEKNLQEQVNAVRDACSDPRKPYRDAAQNLYQTLIAPTEARLAGKKRLLICPDGVLWDVPFAALLAGSGDASKPDAFLMQKFEIAYAYSATGAEAERKAQSSGERHHPTKTMLAFANPEFGGDLRFGDNPAIPGQRPIGAPSRPIGAPSRPIGAPSRPIGAPSRPIGAASRPIGAPSRPIGAPSRPIGAPSRDPLQLLRGGFLVELPGTQQEARAIKNDFPNAVVYTRDAAQESVAKREAGKYRYLHFATHGFFNDAAPLLSAIVLALPDKKSGDDGFLTAREIFDLNLNADMVVLSACNTARGEKRNGEGMIGLTWALFAAGAPTQVVSQWSVNDQSTALLMQRFYANLTKKHEAKGEALRQASLSLLNEDNRKSKIENRKYAHPYYWAPFILLGNWGK